MHTNFIDGIIRRSNLKLLALSALGLVAVLGVMALALNMYYNLFAGPFTVTPQYVENIKDVNNLKEYYISVTGEEAIDTGFQRVRKQYGLIETGRESFVALLVGEHYLIVQTPGDATDTRQYSGALRPMPPVVEREVVNKIIADYPDLDGVFLPYILDAGDFRLDGFLSLGVGMIGVVGCMWVLSGAVLRMTNPANHPIMKGLARFGDPKSTADQIDFEIGQDHTIINKNTHLTKHWLVYYTGTALAATPIKDVMWLYKSVTQHRTNGINSGKTFGALIWDRYGVCITIPGKEKQVLEVLEAVINRAPWCAMGYQPDIEVAYKKDRSRFASAVDQRREQMITQARQGT